jgi:hypothetical protein
MAKIDAKSTVKIDESEIRMLMESLSVASRHLAETAASLAVGAAPAVGMPLSVPPFASSFPPDPFAAPTAIPPAVATGPPIPPVAFPPAGVPVAKLLTSHAAPVAYSAPVVALAVPVLARALGR